MHRSTPFWLVTVTAFSVVAFLLISAWAPAPVDACIWDTDTLDDERDNFPSLLELIAGKFNRHSQAYYRWRMADRTEKLRDKPDHHPWLDDLAVAHDKLGEHDMAIELATRQLELDPDRYETLANLGTFYFHSGQLEAGLPFIRKAIEVNPDAHFGRERIQLYLVEYVLERMKATGADTVPLPLGQADREDPSNPHDYGTDEYKAFQAKVESLRQTLEDHGYSAGYEGPRRGSWIVFLALRGVKREAAIKGVAGMMRFGNPDSPVLLEALGELLIGGHTGHRITGSDANRLAARCFVKAARQVAHLAQVEAHYLARAEACMRQQEHEESLTRIENQLEFELAEGAAWVERIRADEVRWIEADEDVDAMFASTYRNEPEGFPRGRGVDSVFSGGMFDRTTIILVSLVAFVLLMTGLGYRSWRKRARIGRERADQLRAVM